MKPILRAGRVVAGGLGVGLVLAVGFAAPAMASTVEDGEVLGDDLSLGRVLLTYVGIPLLIIATIWVLASLPYMLGAPRYRPGVSWWAAPVWINGPDDFAEPSKVMDDAPPPASADLPDSAELVSPKIPGGTSARW